MQSYESSVFYFTPLGLGNVNTSLKTLNFFANSYFDLFVFIFWLHLPRLTYNQFSIILILHLSLTFHGFGNDLRKSVNRVWIKMKIVVLGKSNYIFRNNFRKPMKVHSVTFYSCGSITIWQTAHWNIKSLRPDGKKWLSEGDNG